MNLERRDCVRAAVHRSSSRAAGAETERRYRAKLQRKQRVAECEGQSFQGQHHII